MVDHQIMNLLEFIIENQSHIPVSKLSFVDIMLDVVGDAVTLVFIDAVKQCVDDFILALDILDELVIIVIG